MDNVENLVKLRREGMSFGNIAKQTGIPKSTIAHKVKEFILQEKTDGPQDVARFETPSKIVQDSNEIIDFSDIPECENVPSNAVPNAVPNVERDAVRNTHRKKHQRTPIGWVDVFWFIGVGFVVVSMLVFLVLQAQPFYAHTTSNELLGWVLAVSFEFLLLILASTRTSERVDVFLPKDLVKSLPNMMRWVVLKSAILGLMWYSYSVVSVSVDLKRAELNPIPQARITSLEKDLEVERSLMRTNQRAGAIRYAQENSERMQQIRTQISELSKGTMPASVSSAKEEQAKLEKGLRALALLVVVLLGHLLGTRGLELKRSTSHQPS
jgi:hypothetical protein